MKTKKIQNSIAGTKQQHNVTASITSNPKKAHRPMLHKARTHLEGGEFSLSGEKMKLELTSLQDKINTLEEKLQIHHTERLHREENSLSLFNSAKESINSPKEHHPIEEDIIMHQNALDTVTNTNYAISKAPHASSTKAKSKPKTAAPSTSRPSKQIAAINKEVDTLKKEVKKWKAKHIAIKAFCDKLKADYKDLSNNYKVSEALRKQQQQLIQDLKSHTTTLISATSSSKKRVKKTK